MAMAKVVQETWHDGHRIHAVGTITISGSYIANGDTLDLSGIKFASTFPDWVEIYGISGYVYSFVRGTTIANGKVRIFEAGADAGALDQRGAGAHPAAITGDVVRFHAIFKKK